MPIRGNHGKLAVEPGTVRPKVVPRHLLLRSLATMPRWLGKLTCLSLEFASAAMFIPTPVYSRISALEMQYVQRSRDEFVEGRVLPTLHPETWEEDGDEWCIVPPGASSTIHQDRDPALFTCHPALHLGKSKIHRRGIMTAEPIQKGTVLWHTHKISYVDAIQTCFVLANKTVKSSVLPRFIHRCGGLIHIPINTNVLYVVNHSCNPNCINASTTPGARSWFNAVMGQLPTEELEASGGVVACTSKPVCPYMDANSFIAARDIAAGEEITINYRTQISPLYPSEMRYLISEQKRCRCQASNCEGEIYPTEFLDSVDFLEGSSSLNNLDRLQDALKALEAKGYNDEVVMLSLLQDRSPLVSYMHNANEAIPYDEALIAQLEKKSNVIRFGNTELGAVALRVALSDKDNVSAGLSAIEAETADPDASTSPAATRVVGSKVTSVVERRTVPKEMIVAEIKTTLDKLLEMVPRPAPKPSPGKEKGHAASVEGESASHADVGSPMASTA